jgi:superoxide dismutase, Cu-Zn family
MTPRSKQIIGGAVLGATVLATAGVVAAVSTSGRSTGPDYVYGVDNPFADASAAVHVVATGAGMGLTTLHVRGVDATTGRTFGAHVHAKACGALGSDAGGHYLHAAPAPGSPLEPEEVWLDVTIDEDGNGVAHAKRPWTVDETTPRSVILHANPTAPDGTAGARLACIDLDGD